VHDDPEEEEIPLKRKRISSVDKGKQVQTQTHVPSCGAPLGGAGLFQLPQVWSESESFGSKASLFLKNPELKAIHDLGIAGRTRAVTEGVVSAMKALKIVVYMNNSSTKEVVRSDALVREKEVMSNRIAELEAKLDASMKVSSKKDKMLALMEKKVDSAARYYQELKEARLKFAAEKKALENALPDSQPGEDKTNDTAVLARHALVYRIEELERNLVGAARHGFHNALDQLKVLNPDVKFSVDGIHFLKYVENENIVSPQVDVGHV